MVIFDSYVSLPEGIPACEATRPCSTDPHGYVGLFANMVSRDVAI